MIAGDRKEIMEAATPERPPPERSEELEAAIRELVEKVHDLLDGPNGSDALTYSPETQKVVLHVPRAFIELAAFVAVVDEEQEEPLAFWKYVRTTPDDRAAAKHLNRMRNRYLERALDQAMHLTLHLLATDALRLTGRRGLNEHRK